MAGLLTEDAVRKKLNGFLDRSARHPFQWGQHDCMLDVADWLDHACGLDLASRWRGRYASEAELEALLAPLGGFGPVMQAEAELAGLAEATELDPGNVALVTLSGQDKPLGAILMPSGRWRLRTLSGFVVTAAVSILTMWSLPCRPSLRPRS
jgi:hypothetical protein